VSLLSLETSRQGDAVLLALSGELDLSSALVLDEELRRAEDTDARELVLDLCGLKFLDSTGLRTILSARARATRDGRAFRVVAGNDSVRRILRLTGMSERLNVEPA
jgi:anti-sigma B factor antagonist